jgi:hypothetical protein
MGHFPIVLRHVAFKLVDAWAKFHLSYVKWLLSRECTHSSTLGCKGVKRINLHSSVIGFEEIFKIARQF